MLVEFPVYLEEKKEVLTLLLSPEDAEKAQNESDFLLQKVQEASETAELKAQSVPLQSSPATPKPKKPLVMQSGEEEIEGVSKFLWGYNSIMGLTEIYRQNKHQFALGKKSHKKVWAEIAAELKATNKEVAPNGKQCQSKISGLRRTYFDIKQKNAKTGIGTTTWPYYQIMDSIIAEDQWFTTPTIISTEAQSGIPNDEEGFSQQSGHSSSSTSPHDGPSRKKRRVDDVLETFLKQIKEVKRREIEEYKRRAEERERNRQKRHDENIQMQKAILDVLRKIVDK